MRATLEQDQAFADAPEPRADDEAPTAAEQQAATEFYEANTIAQPVGGFKLARGTKSEPLPDRDAENQKLLASLETPAEGTPGTPQTGVATTTNDRNQLGISVAQDAPTLMQWGLILFQSGAFPGLKSPQDAVARMLMARSLRIDEVKAMYMFHNVGDKLILSADLTRYLLDRAGVRYKVLENRVLYLNPDLATQQYPNGQNDFRTKIRMKQDSTGKDFIWEVWWSELHPFWSGKNKDTWAKFPKAMALHACMRQCARFYFPGVLGGMHELEELGYEDTGTFATEVSE